MSTSLVKRTRFDTDRSPDQRADFDRACLGPERGVFADLGGHGERVHPNPLWQPW